MLPMMPGQGPDQCCTVPAPQIPQNPYAVDERVGSERTRPEQDSRIPANKERRTTLKGERGGFKNGGFSVPENFIGSAADGFNGRVNAALRFGHENTEVDGFEEADSGVALSYQKGDEKPVDGRRVGRIRAAGMVGKKFHAPSIESAERTDFVKYVDDVSQLALQYRALKAAIGVRQGDISVNATVIGGFAGKIEDGMFVGDSKGEFKGTVNAENVDFGSMRILRNTTVDYGDNSTVISGTFKGSVSDAILYDGSKGVGVVNGITAGRVRGIMDGNVNMDKSFKDARFDGMVAELLACGLSVKEMKAEANELGMLIKRRLTGKDPKTIRSLSKNLQHRLRVHVAGLFPEIDRKYFAPTLSDKHHKMNEKDRRPSRSAPDDIFNLNDLSEDRFGPVDDYELALESGYDFVPEDNDEIRAKMADAYDNSRFGDWINDSKLDRSIYERGYLEWYESKYPENKFDNVDADEVLADSVIGDFDVNGVVDEALDDLQDDGEIIVTGVVGDEKPTFEGGDKSIVSDVGPTSKIAAPKKPPYEVYLDEYYNVSENGGNGNGKPKKPAAKTGDAKLGHLSGEKVADWDLMSGFSFAGAEVPDEPDFSDAVRHYNVIKNRAARSGEFVD